MNEDVKETVDSASVKGNTPSVQEQLAASQVMMQQQMAQAQMMQQQTQQQMLLQMQKKSMVAAILLSLFFGPLGLFYATIKGGVIMLVLSIVLLFFTFGFSLFFMWIPCVIWAYIAVDKYNKELMINGAPPTE